MTGTLPGEADMSAVSMDEAPFLGTHIISRSK